VNADVDVFSSRGQFVSGEIVCVGRAVLICSRCDMFAVSIAICIMGLCLPGFCSAMSLYLIQITSIMDFVQCTSKSDANRFFKYETQIVFQSYLIQITSIMDTKIVLAQ
jgi:hypothetical protein